MASFKQLTRWDEWVESKTPLFLAAAYTWLLGAAHAAGPELVIRAGLWLLFTLCFLAFGYAVNDYADREADRRAGKPNAIARLGERRAKQFLALIALAGPLSLLPFLSAPWVAPALLAAYFFAAAYSLPPLRFKERGVIGIVVSATAQRLFPLLVGMAVLGRFDGVSWVMATLFSLMGARWILVHQIGDVAADERGGVKSFTRSRGSAATLRLMQWVVFPAELLFLAVWMALAARQWAGVLIALPAYLLWLALARRARGVWPVAWARFGALPLTQFYFIFWPLALAAGALAETPPAVFLLLWQLILTRDYLTAQWRTLFPARLAAEF